MQLRHYQDQLDSLDVRVAVVTFELDVIARNYVAANDLPWPLLVDSSREVYRAYGMHRGRWWKIAGPATWWSYAKLLLRGRKLQRSSNDVWQLGGDVLIDPHQIVRFQHIGSGPADRPEIETLLKAVRVHQ